MNVIWHLRVRILNNQWDIRLLPVIRKSFLLYINWMNGMTGDGGAEWRHSTMCDAWNNVAKNTKGKLSINSDAHTISAATKAAAAAAAVSSSMVWLGITFFVCVEKSDLCAIPAIIIPDLVFSFRLIRENYKIIGFWVVNVCIFIGRCSNVIV